MMGCHCSLAFMWLFSKPYDFLSCRPHLLLLPLLFHQFLCQFHLKYLHQHCLRNVPTNVPTPTATAAPAPAATIS
ncbi:hypothetical protein B296_00010865 [Ensete ventricosum]|uniref:Secreted protein n=1 Tax=Ensete ventricosum TaxID=4639 RepID=A0A427AKV1_ENSVE|nr:hypothetical protein B296_00010865 [Ensete ventricosum]